MKAKILHIDDSEANRYAVKHILENAGYEVIEAETGKKGLALAESNPDLIVLDIRLPDINGFDICRTIKSNPKTASIPVLQTSAMFTSSDNKVEGLESGADGYLAQPIEGAVLVATVRSLLRIRAAERESQLATRARDEMMAIVSHDLRNPLSAIMLQVKLLKKVYEDKGEVADLSSKLDRIGNSCHRMNRLIQDLLDVSSMEGGKFNINRNPFSASDLLKETVTHFEELAEQKSISLKLNIAQNVSLVGDRDRIHQVLLNLISNSLKFTDEKGSVSVSLLDEKDESVFCIQDTGKGIDPEFIPHIFDRYWQGHMEKRDGVGLGLSIVKGIVDAHGGKIKVESEPGKGTLICFTVPK